MYFVLVLKAHNLTYTELLWVLVLSGFYSSITTYHAKTESKIVKKDLLKLKGPTVRQGSTGTWTGESILIPVGIPPTRLAGRSTVISVEYLVEITLETAKGKKITAQIPIIIGTIPFGSKVEDLISSAIAVHPMQPDADADVVTENALKPETS